MSATQNSVEPGHEVMLGSGIFGTVVSVSDESLELEVAPGTAIKVARQAVVRVLEQQPAPGEPIIDATTDSDTTPGNVIDEQ